MRWSMPARRSTLCITLITCGRLGKPGERWLETLQPEDRLRLETLRTNHALEDTKVWFDLIDDPSLHNDHIYACAVNLFIQHADYVTTSSRILKRRYESVRPDIVLVEQCLLARRF